MTPDQFVFWLRGFAELNASEKAPSPQQWAHICKELLVIKPNQTLTIAPSGCSGCKDKEQDQQKLRPGTVTEVDPRRVI